MRGVQLQCNAPSLIPADPGHFNFMLSRASVTASFSDDASCLRNATHVVTKYTHCQELFLKKQRLLEEE